MSYRRGIQFPWHFRENAMRFVLQSIVLNGISKHLFSAKQFLNELITSCIRSKRMPSFTNLAIYTSPIKTSWAKCEQYECRSEQSERKFEWNGFKWIIFRMLQIQLSQLDVRNSCQRQDTIPVPPANIGAALLCTVQRF